MSVFVPPISRKAVSCSVFLYRIRECGHYFCGPCLRLHFSVALEKQLESIPLLFFFKSDLYDTYKVPKCKEHLDRILDGLRSSEVPPHTIFQYHCPQCHIFVRKVPVHLEIAHKILSGTTESLVGTELAEHGVELFDGLFLTSHDDIANRQVIDLS